MKEKPKLHFEAVQMKFAKSRFDFKGKASQGRLRLYFSSISLVLCALGSLLALCILKTSASSMQAASLGDNECKEQLFALSSSYAASKKTIESLQSHLILLESEKGKNSNTEPQSISVSQIASDAATASFGPEPYHVELIVSIPLGAGRKEGRILMQMAPLEFVPYTLWFFLTQVEKGLWSNCSFIRNARHVLQAHPETVDRKSRMHVFEPPLRSVKFQEYSAAFPHEKFTVGLAGRPGGPDFYISLKNNTLNHGPGGQKQYMVQQEADPCFAKVIEGFDVLKDMSSLPVADQGYNRLVNNVEIVSMKIVHL